MASGPITSWQIDGEAVETVAEFGFFGSPSGNRTPVSRMTGGDTHHYTNEDSFTFIKRLLSSSTYKLCVFRLKVEGYLRLS